MNPLQPDRASALGTGGIYRHTRSPMYPGMALALLGVAGWLWWAPAVLATAAFVAFITRFQIQPGARVLSHTSGAVYADHCRSVRRWV